MRLLILGGTADGRHLAEFFYSQGLLVIYSVAGLVSVPKVSCEIISGGFTQFGGLAEFIKQKAITAILDVTHPYAVTMSNKAVSAAKNCHIPCWRFHRESWLAEAGDNWIFFEYWDDLAAALAPYRRVLLTCGQLTDQELKKLAGYKEQKQFLRTAVTPKANLLANMNWIKAIGPFALDDEKKLIEKESIDVLVSKNSGGDATSAKLYAARALGIPVMMLSRPALPDADALLTGYQQCQDYILGNFTHAG